MFVAILRQRELVREMELDDTTYKTQVAIRAFGTNLQCIGSSGAVSRLRKKLYATSVESVPEVRAAGNTFIHKRVHLFDSRLITRSASEQHSSHLFSVSTPITNGERFRTQFLAPEKQSAHQLQPFYRRRHKMLHLWFSLRVGQGSPGAARYPLCVAAVGRTGGALSCPPSR